MKQTWRVLAGVGLVAVRLSAVASHGGETVITGNESSPAIVPGETVASSSAVTHTAVSAVSALLAQSQPNPAPTPPPTPLNYRTQVVAQSQPNPAPTPPPPPQSRPGPKGSSDSSGGSKV
jgi:hypothetical protein